MAAIKPTHSVLPTKSQWPIVDKAAFWKEDRTVMKIVKIISMFIIVPLAFFMDLISKAYNYVWPKTEPVTPEKLGCWQQVKNRAATTLTKVKKFWVTYKKEILISSSLIGAGLLGWYFFASTKPAEQIITGFSNNVTKTNNKIDLGSMICTEKEVNSDTETKLVRNSINLNEV